MADYKEMVARAEPVEEGECCPEFWEKAEGEIAGFLSDLVQRYNPAQPVGEGPMANTGKMRWVDSDDLPRFEQGVVVAAQVARPPLGWTGNHALARCCLRTPRPFLNGGGEWRRTYVLLRPDTAGEETTWRVTRGWVPWSLLKNPHGVIPFPGYRILWIVTFFFDRTAWKHD
jgi:hypothetical protein